jgi:hypothetical protein
MIDERVPAFGDAVRDALRNLQDPKMRTWRRYQAGRAIGPTRHAWKVQRQSPGRGEVQFVREPTYIVFMPATSGD